MTSIPHHEPHPPDERHDGVDEGPKITPPPPRARSRKMSLALIFGSLTVFLVLVLLLVRL